MSGTVYVKLNNFRAFADTEDVPVKPLTILVGENSTGKTSFLAALRYLMASMKGRATQSFNVYPFDLGSYSDIVHQGGSASATQRFSLEIQKEVDLSASGFSRQIVGATGRQFELIRAKFIFRDSYGEPVHSAVEFVLGDLKLEVRFAKTPQLLFYRGGKRFYEMDPSRFGFYFPDEIGERSAFEFSMLTYVLQEAYFETNRTGKSNNLSKEDRLGVQRLVGAFLSFVGSMPSSVHASAPVRSHPARYYGPSEAATQTPEARTLYDLNKMKRSNRREWLRVNVRLSHFGKLAGLFSRFDIVKLGRAGGSPFEVRVTVRGHSSNLIDVGYGVSQSLPIITELIESSDDAAFLFQQPEVHLHPKAQASLGSFFASYIMGHKDCYVIAETHSDYLIDRLRIEIRNKRLWHGMVSILFFDHCEGQIKVHAISLDEAGNLVGVPANYRDFFIREEEAVLGLRDVPGN